LTNSPKQTVSKKTTAILEVAQTTLPAVLRIEKEILLGPCCSSANNFPWWPYRGSDTWFSQLHQDFLEKHPQNINKC